MIYTGFKMGLWSKGLERAQTGEWRKESNVIVSLKRIRNFINEYMYHNGHKRFWCSFVMDGTRCRWMFDMMDGTCHEVIQKLNENDFTYSILLDFRTKSNQFKKDDIMMMKVFSKISENIWKYVMTGCTDEDLLFELSN